MITSKMKRRIKHNLSSERPSIQVGKEGPTQQIINEIGRHLELHEMIKAKILQSALKSEETKQIATRIADQLGATLIEVRGHTFILYRKKSKKPR